jgi:hypothetical protein
VPRPCAASAHGRFENVVADEAPRIISGVRDFIVISRSSAIAQFALDQPIEGRLTRCPRPARVESPRDPRRRSVLAVDGHGEEQSAEENDRQLRLAAGKEEGCVLWWLDQPPERMVVVHALGADHLAGVLALSHHATEVVGVRGQPPVSVVGEGSDAERDFRPHAGPGVQVAHDAHVHDGPDLPLAGSSALHPVALLGSTLLKASEQALRLLHRRRDDPCRTVGAFDDAGTQVWPALVVDRDSDTVVRRSMLQRMRDWPARTARVADVVLRSVQQDPVILEERLIHMDTGPAVAWIADVRDRERRSDRGRDRMLRLFLARQRRLAAVHADLRVRLGHDSSLTRAPAWNSSRDVGLSARTTSLTRMSSAPGTASRYVIIAGPPTRPGEDALRILVVLAENHHPRFEKTAARFAARVVIARRLEPWEAHRIFALAQAMPESPEALGLYLRRSC